LSLCRFEKKKAFVYRVVVLLYYLLSKKKYRDA